MVVLWELIAFSKRVQTGLDSEKVRQGLACAFLLWCLCLSTRDCGSTGVGKGDWTSSSPRPSWRLEVQARIPGAREAWAGSCLLGRVGSNPRLLVTVWSVNYARKGSSANMSPSRTLWTPSGMHWARVRADQWPSPPPCGHTFLSTH